jgi:transcriptional regulator with XRE-family HTH domain
MGDREPTMRSRELGEALRQAMERAGLNGREVARLLGWSPGWVSRLLSGKRNVTELDVSAFLGACRVRGKERDRLLELCRDTGTPGWFLQYGARVPKQVRVLVDHENRATEITDFQPIVIPGLLQTEHYARALIEGADTLAAHEVKERVVARLARQKLLTERSAPRFTFFIHEFVLRLPVGDSEVMSDQLDHLLRMAVLPRVTLRVLPARVGAHAGIAGAFKLMEFPEFRPVVYLDSQASSVFLEKPEETAPYQNLVTLLADAALTEGQSREFIAGLGTELYGGRTDHDVRAPA